MMSAESGKIQKQNIKLNFLTLFLISLAVFAVFAAALPNLVRALFSSGRSVRVTTEADHLLPPAARSDELAPVGAHGGSKRSAGPIRSDSKWNQDPSGDYESNDPRNIPDSLKNPFEEEEEPPGTLHHEKHSDPFAENEKGSEQGAGKDETKPDSPVKMGMARAAMVLRDGPFETAVEMAEVEAGAQVVVLKELNGFVLVVHGGKMGWARKSDIVVR